MATSTANRRVSQTTSIPAPVGGWNARDPEADMDPRDAVELVNFFPGTGSVDLRKGYTQHVTGIGQEVESLMPYNAVDGTQTLFAAADDSFYNVTSSGAVGAAVVTGLSNARWQHVNFTNTAGTSYLCAFNGSDNPRYWDGSTWTSVSSGSSPAITGVTSSALNNPWVHKRRLWAIETDTLSAWYFPVDSVGGALQEFDLSGLFRMGGYLVAGGTWTMDAGEGLDDYWVGITSEGEVAVYQGTDPSSSSTWNIVGVWRIGEPIGNRPFLKFAGDLLVICRDGVYPLSKALQSSQVTINASITSKINRAVTNASNLYSTNFGWELEFYPEGNMLILNVPVTSSQEQYVMNTITGAWGQFKGVKANCWAISNGIPYFGGDGFVGEFWQTTSDNSNNITGDIQQAYFYFGDRGSLKRWSMIRPIITANGSPSVLATLNVDFEKNNPSNSLSFTPVTYGVWGTSDWGAGVWASGEGIVLKDWQGVGAIGNCAGLRLKCAANGIEVSMQAVDYVFEIGGVI